MAIMRVKSTLDSTEYKNGIKDMQRQNKGFGGSLGKIGPLMKKAFAAAAILATIKAIGRAIVKTTEYAAELQDLADQAGVNVETLQALGRAASRTGEDMDTVRDALGAIKTAQGEALEGAEDMITNFKTLGISINEIGRLGPDQLFARIGKAMEEGGLSAREFAAAAKIIGEGDVLKLRQTFEEAAGGLDSLSAKYDVVTQKNTLALQKLRNGVKDWSQGIKDGFANVIGKAAQLIIPAQNIQNEIERGEQNIQLTREANLQALRDLQDKQAKEKQEQLDKENAKFREQAKKRAEKLKEIASSVTLEIQTDSLRRIGGFAGARVSDTMALARQQLEVNKRIEDYSSNLPDIKRNTENTGLK